MKQGSQPTRLYSDYAFAWTISGITVIRARSQSEATEKFHRLSRAAMLNQAIRKAFMSAPLGEKTHSEF